MGKQLDITIGGYNVWLWGFKRHPEMWVEPVQRSCWVPHWSLFIGPIWIRWLEYCHADDWRPTARKNLQRS